MKDSRGRREIDGRRGKKTMNDPRISLISRLPRDAKPQSNAKIIAHVQSATALRV
jgi:hypothetical protein